MYNRFLGKATVVAIFSFCMAADVLAARYFWATNGAENGDLATLRNWTPGSAAGINSPAAFNAADQYTIRDTSNLPADVHSWYINADLDMLGFFEAIRTAQVDLNGHALSVKYILCRGDLSFSGGSVSTSDQSYCGNQDTPGSCRLSFDGEGTAFSVPELKAVSISSSSVDGASNNRLEILNGARMLSGRIAIGNNSAVAEGNYSTNNAFIVSGYGSSAKINNIDLRAGSKNIFKVSDGASVYVTNTLTSGGNYCIKIGSYDRADGDIVVVTGSASGHDSSLEVSGAVNMGCHANSHEHRFIVADGATASVGSFQLGQTSGSTGNVVRVTGPGSSLTVSGTTYVGGNQQTGMSSARLEVLDGATYETTGNAQLWIGRFSNGCELFVSNATAKVAGELRLGWASGDVTSANAGGSATIRIAGEAPLFEVAGAVSSYSPTVQKMVFDMPSAGWSSAPVKFKSSAKIVYGTDSSLEIIVNANHVEPGRYVLVASTADINFGKIALSNGSTGLVTLDDSVSKEIAVVVKRPGLAIFVR